jgi:hypothetical protein
MVSGSGEQEKFIPGEPEPIRTPYLINNQIELTFKCEQIGDGVEPGKKYWFLNATHAKVSDPYFGCTEGCVPILDLQYIAFPLPGESGGELQLFFPNGNGLTIAPLVANPDAQKIFADQSNHPELIDHSNIGYYPEGMVEHPHPAIEEVTFRCQNPTCTYELQGVTMALNKIS